MAYLRGFSERGKNRNGGPTRSSLIGGRWRPAATTAPTRGVGLHRQHHALARAVWSGDQLLWEFKSAAGPAGGNVGYFHAGGIDRPLMITKDGTSVIPHENWRGQFSRGTYTSGYRSDCTSYPASGCTPIQWPGERTTVRHELEEDGRIQNWFGGLVDGMRDARLSPVAQWRQTVLSHLAMHWQPFVWLPSQAARSSRQWPQMTAMTRGLHHESLLGARYTLILMAMRSPRILEAPLPGHRMVDSSRAVTRTERPVGSERTGGTSRQPTPTPARSNPMRTVRRQEIPTELLGFP